MTYQTKRTDKLTNVEYDEMVALKKAINEHPHSVSPEKMEKFSEYLVRSLKELGT